MTTIVTFKFEPDEPDDDDSTGMSAEEYDRLMDQLAMLGGFDIEVNKAP